MLETKKDRDNILPRSIEACEIASWHEECAICVEFHLTILLGGHLPS
jgi:hypothetical protein